MTLPHRKLEVNLSRLAWLSVYGIICYALGLASAPEVALFGHQATKVVDQAPAGSLMIQRPVEAPVIKRDPTPKP